MKATTPKPRKKSTATAKKSAKTSSVVGSTTAKRSAAAGRFTGTSVTGKKLSHAGSIMSITVAKTSGKQKEPAWVRQEVKGLMDALSGR
jgi:hypothetical protein